MIVQTSGSLRLPSRPVIAARGRSLDGRVAGAVGPDLRRRDAGDALSSPSSGEHRDGPTPPQGVRPDFCHGLLGVHRFIDFFPADHAVFKPGHAEFYKHDDDA
jgi:hypothetical protein